MVFLFYLMNIEIYQIIESLYRQLCLTAQFSFAQVSFLWQFDVLPFFPAQHVHTLQSVVPDKPV